MTIRADREVEVAALTSPAFGELAATGRLVVLVPVGSVEPHGPHLALETDTLISTGACRRAVAGLFAADLEPVIAPPVGYGVTDCAARFPGAISIPAETLSPFLRAVAAGYLAAGAAHVCLVNNHLEPAHDRAVRGAVADLDGASVACPLERRWARTLSDEFKSGACHAGRYETSLVLAERADRVTESERADLPEVPVSLSDALLAGVSDFADMGLDQAYAGNPAAATADEGEDLYARLADMIVGTVTEAFSS